MPRPVLEVADIFRSHGAAWRRANAGHLSLGQLKAMAAIEACRTAELGGHVARCDDCGNRHCPKCHVWTAPAVQEESGGSANVRSGAVMYAAC